MKALTLWQPWASLVAGGFKRVETRGWTTKHRGLIAIHAAQKIPFKELGASRFRGDFHNEASKCLGADWDKLSLPTGAVLCTAELYNVQEIDPTWVNELSQRERIFGNYEPGRYAWFLRDVKPFKTPIQAKGNRMLWNWERP